jgi:hypothetical protein
MLVLLTGLLSEALRHLWHRVLPCSVATGHNQRPARPLVVLSVLHSVTCCHHTLPDCVHSKARQKGSALQQVTHMTWLAPLLKLRVMLAWSVPR